MPKISKKPDPPQVEVELRVFEKVLNLLRGVPWPEDKVFRFKAFCLERGEVIPRGGEHHHDMIKNPSNLIAQFEQRQGACS